MNKDKETKAAVTEEAVEAPSVTEPKTKVVKAEIPKKEEKPKTLAGNKMYIGPTIDGVARTGEVYKDGILPAKAQECVIAFPAFSQLFVDVACAVEALAELKTGKGTLCAIYKLAVEKFKGGK